MPAASVAAALRDGVGVDPGALAERIRSGAPLTVLDVRDRDEFESWSIDGPGVTAAQVPLMRFVQAEVAGDPAELVAGLDKPIVVVCARGESSDHVAELLREAGVDAVNLEGGMTGWARVYRAVEVDRSPSPSPPAVSVLQYQRPSSGCVAHLVVAGDEAAVVDPLAAFAERYAADAAARGATLRYAVDTHVHADHVSGVRDVAAATDAAAVLPAGARDRGLDFEARLLADGESLPLGETTLEAVHAPGHTTEMTALRVGDLLLTGDLVFLDGVARPDLETGDEGARDAAGRLYRTLTGWLADQPREAVVAPGHYGSGTDPAPDGTYTATVGDLFDRLSVLSLDESTFVPRVGEDLPPRPANYERIVAINLGRDAASEDEAFELELGPNNCAVTSTAD